MSSITFALVLFAILSCSLVESKDTFDVTKYGAKGDGHFNNTAAIAKAIDEASKAADGGIVHFPVGQYFTGPIHLKSHVHLHFADGVGIKFSDHFDDYLPMVEVRYGGAILKTFSPLIYGYNITDIQISGNATLDGSGKKWWDLFKHLKSYHKKTGHYNITSKWQVEFHKVNHELAKHAAELFDDHSDISSGFLRPPFFQVLHSNQITLENLTFINSPFWTVTPALSDNIIISGLNISNPATSPNTDGIDPDSCRNVTITKSFIDVGDDCVCIKSGKDKQGRLINRPSENITVTDCVMHAGHGGLVIGSEMSGGVRNIFASRLTFVGTLRGIRIKSTRGRGGVVENVFVSNVTMSDISHEGITINTYYTKAAEEPFSERTPIFRNITIENVTGDSKIGIVIMGLPEKHLDNIHLKNIHMEAKKPMVISDADHVVQTNVTYIHH